MLKWLYMVYTLSILYYNNYNDDIYHVQSAQKHTGM